MEYFARLQQLLNKEKEEDKRSYEAITLNMPVTERRENGMCWYPIAIRESEIGKGDYLTIEVERTTNQEILHQFRFGMTVALFSQHDSRNNRLEGTLTHTSGNRMKIALRVDDLPDWSRDGKLGVDVVFDENSYTEMELALKHAPSLAEKSDTGKLIRILTGTAQPTFHELREEERGLLNAARDLNPSQLDAIRKILSAQELAIVHGPPGTGKTTTLVQAIKLLVRQKGGPVLVCAPSNAAVDLLSERLDREGLNVVRVGNPARVNEKQEALTLDHRITQHPSSKEIKRLKKQSAEYVDLAHRYKRSFGAAEREQRKALFAEARKLRQEIEQTEKYITDAIIGKAEVITATLVGAAHYSIRHLKYQTVVIDEAAQALEPACWIPILKAQRLVMAGDHCQLPPTIRSEEAARGGLAETLMEKAVKLYPEAVTMLDTQYRMNEKIAAFPSREFYAGKLHADPSVANWQLADGDAPLLFIDTAGCGFEESREGNGIANPEEAQFTNKQVARLQEQLHDQFDQEALPTIGVISPYRHQVELLKELISPAPNITVNTIDSFQGQERDIIFISLTRSNAESTIGFLSEVRRMNVAMTRARKRLVMIGDSATLSGFPFYADLIAYAQEEEGYKSAWEFMID
ncbi:AAA domain-containing protein [Flavihumibacter rivuli]|uniref:AAA domain-containing protein n=1 Tax=Flavihumibacter rivuli TaxID=2838156 RepID=UPI001BDE7413|nr:AAA domain-containing protein [Flavihumibacter rivuli]ULQ55983.1 AAA domain-containing protein [Flavihumibacter rivuli]